MDRFNGRPLWVGVCIGYALGVAVSILVHYLFADPITAMADGLIVAGVVLVVMLREKDEG